MGMPGMRRGTEMKNYCTFCGRAEDEVEVLVKDPGSGACICYVCASIAHDCACAYLVAKRARQDAREELMKWKDHAP